MERPPADRYRYAGFDSRPHQIEDGEICRPMFFLTKPLSIHGGNATGCGLTAACESEVSEPTS